MNQEVIRDNPWMVIIAGPNGAGKSTFYDLVWQEDPLFKNVDFVNMDNYARELAGPDGDPNDFMLEAGRRVVNRLKQNFKERKNFIYETTSSGQTHLRVMEKAKKLGYDIATMFIGLNDVELSHLRVQQRIEEGGHSVPPEDIDRRYPNIIKNFPDMLMRSDVAAVFDNSFQTPYKLIFFMDHDRINVYHKYPNWLKETFAERKTNKQFIQVPAEEIKQLKKERVQFARRILLKNKELTGK